jgi:hypothetical protein
MTAVTSLSPFAPFEEDHSNNPSRGFPGVGAVYSYLFY